MADAPASHPPLILTIKDKNAIYMSYMPFIKNGGLFIPSNRDYKLGDEVLLLITLTEETERFSVKGKVVWITPRGAQGNRVAGIGVQFNDPEAHKKIDGYLTAIKTDRPTHTL